MCYVLYCLCLWVGYFLLKRLRKGGVLFVEPKTLENGVEMEKSSEYSVSSIFIFGKVGLEMGSAFSMLFFSFCVSEKYSP